MTTNHFSRVILFILLLAAVGCGSAGNTVIPKSRYLDSGQRTPAVPLSAEGKDANLFVTLQTVIVPDGPGSWLRSADWDEFVIELENRSSERVTLHSWHLIDPRGVYVASESTMQALEAKSRALQTEYEGYGIAYTKYIGMHGAYVAAMAGPGILASGVLGATAIAAAPLAAAAVPAYVYWHYHTKTTGMAQIDGEFARRITPQPLIVAPGAKIRASLFFPLVPSPSALVVGYGVGQREASLTVGFGDLLRGLHEETRAVEPRK